MGIDTIIEKYAPLNENIKRNYTNLIADFYTRYDAVSSVADVGKILAGQYRIDGKRVWRWEDRLRTLSDMLKNTDVDSQYMLQAYSIINENRYLKRKARNIPQYAKILDKAKTMLCNLESIVSPLPQATEEKKESLKLFNIDYRLARDSIAAPVVSTLVAAKDQNTAYSLLKDRLDSDEEVVFYDLEHANTTELKCIDMSNLTGPNYNILLTKDHARTDAKFFRVNYELQKGESRKKSKRFLAAISREEAEEMMADYFSRNIKAGKYDSARMLFKPKEILKPDVTETDLSITLKKLQ